MSLRIYKHKKHSRETIEKIRLGNKGKHKYWLGKKRSEEDKKKMSLAHKGNKAYQWKGGNSKGYKTGYYSREYKIWRISVFERDQFRCQVCGIVGKYLTAHHIKSFAKFPKLRLELDNGITLCEDCHKLTDNYKGREMSR